MNLRHDDVCDGVMPTLSVHYYLLRGQPNALPRTLILHLIELIDDHTHEKIEHLRIELSRDDIRTSAA